MVKIQTLERFRKSFKNLAKKNTIENIPLEKTKQTIKEQMQ